MQTTTADNNVDAIPPELSGLDTVRDKSLKMAGFSHLIGDAFLFTAGIVSGRYKEAATGSLWAGSGLVLARYGNPTAEKKLELLYSDLGDYLAKERVKIPVGNPVRISMLSNDSGMIDHIERFLYRYPSQVANALYTLGATQMIQSGIKHKKHWDTASGALVLAGGLLGLLVPEKKPEQNDVPKNGLQKAWSWVQEKPLRVSGALYMLNNATLARSAFIERKANPKNHSHVFKLLTVASYIVGNSLFALSSKDNVSSFKQKEKKETVAALEMVAAQIINAQPPAVQQDLLNRVAGYLSGEPGVNATAEKLAVDMQKMLRKCASPAAPDTWRDKVQPSQDSASPSL